MSQEIRLADYRPPAYLVRTVDLDVDIRDPFTTVTARLKIARNPKSKDRKPTLFLNGEAQELVSVMVGRQILTDKDYDLTPLGLTLRNLPDRATIEIVSRHNPFENTALSGFYASGSMLSTQCEAEGYRRITYHPDRPDVMAKFRVTLHADRAKYPVLLANGNLVGKGAEPGKRHYAVWEDPYPKPCYLFAMVAGKLDKVTSSYTTGSGRKVLLEIYVEQGKRDQVRFALDALKKSMRWDEKRFGLEYDLDRFMIVATPFFNMGAMENKGLNIFNDACVLGRTDTATDATISFIERVVAHEYFHNWSGNRITCRDWFQLSLKEGLTVFREQEYMGDAHSVAVERLGNVRGLRSGQFAEDAGAMAHPVRPDRYQAIDNFYTPTVYQKGSEVVRMIQTMVGRTGFDKGMKLYVRRHDGQAVTCEDFVAAMADANRLDLTQFLRWYRQAGTPQLDVTGAYDAKKRRYTLTVAQSCGPTPGQPNKLPLHIPLAVGLLDGHGNDMIGTRLLELRKPKEVFTFDGIDDMPVPSLLRGFSAPVRLNFAYTDDELLFLLAHDSDPFSRWEAGFRMATQLLLAPDAERETVFIDALGHVLRDPDLDAAFKGMILSLPGEGELGLALQARGSPINPDRLYDARRALVLRIADALRADLTAEYRRLAETVDAGKADGRTMGRRGLKNLCLSYLCAGGDPAMLKRAYAQATASVSMTDTVAALAMLAESESPLRDKAFAAFARKWAKMPTVMDKWLALQAGAKRRGVLTTVKSLMDHPAFDLRNPNRVSALIGVFTGNPLGFHAADGSGYRFIADMIRTVDQLNPHKGAMLAKAFTRWRDYDEGRQTLMRAQLDGLAAHDGFSANTREIIEKSLA